MYLSVIACNDNLYQEARQFFVQQWRSDLMVKDETSLIWAYLVTKYFRENWKPNFSFIEWVYSYEDLYFSTSHTDNLLMIAVDNVRIAVDFEYMHPRDASLLNSVNVPQSTFSPRENFYIQRTAQECLVKYLSLTSNEMNEMRVVKFDPHHHFSVWDREFSLLITLSFRGSEYRVHAEVKNERIMAFIHDSSSSYNSTTTQSYTAPDNTYVSMERTGMFRPID